MKYKENQRLIIEALIQLPEQPVALTYGEMVKIPSQYMKLTEYQKRLFEVTWDNPHLDPQKVFQVHLKALKRKYRVIHANRLDPKDLSLKQASNG